MKIIDAKLFRDMVLSGTNNLSNNKADVDAMNVFPVPDGDTGTNMTMTFENGLAEAKSVLEDNVGAIAKGLSHGTLMGARGNSGVITSQIFRGFAKAVDGLKEVDVQTVAAAFLKGSQVAYKAVMKPVEGTILTVIREASVATAEFVKDNLDCDVETFFDKLVENAKISLDHTPELMPLLKEVGVVDSGGYGLLKILEGFKEAVHGNVVVAKKQEGQVASAQVQLESEEFGYCTEFILRLSEQGKLTFNEDKMKNSLTRMGNSLVLVQDEDLVKVHVHTMKPGDVLNLGQRYGEFVKLKIENMQLQHEHILEAEKAEAPKEPETEYAIITVAAGKGLGDYFKQIRADEIISGGQTMNPSCEDFVEVIKRKNAKHIFVLPNNSNIIMAAKQAKDILEDKDIIVLETKTINEGIAACIAFNPDVDVEENVEMMKEAIAHIVSGHITYAIKDTEVNGVVIKENDFLGIRKKEIVVSNADLLETAKTLLDKMMFEDAELVTIFTGEDADPETTDEIENYLEEKYDIEVDVEEGDQPVFRYLFGVE